MSDLEREILRAATCALQSLVFDTDDESWKVCIKQIVDRDGHETGEAMSPEYHYWSWLNYCHMNGCDPDADIVGGDLRKVFPHSVRKGGPWETEAVWSCPCGWETDEAFGEIAMSLTDDRPFCPECGEALLEFPDFDPQPQGEEGE